MSLAESLRIGFQIGQQLDSAADEAEKRQAEVKLLQAQAAGQVATAQLNRQKFDQAVQHQSRLAAAFAQQQQSPDAPPGDVPQSRLQQQLGPQADVPPMPIYSRQSGPGVLPSPEQEAAGFQQRFQGPDAQGQMQAFARRYGPQPQGEPVQAAPVPQAATPPPGEPRDAPVPAVPPQGPGEAPPGSGGVTQPGTVSSTPPVVTGPTLPQDQGEPRIRSEQRPANGTASAPDDTQLLRDLSKTYFLNNQPQIALTLHQYSDQQTQLRNLARVYKEVLSDPSASAPQRTIALAGLGEALVRASKVDSAMELLNAQLPLSDRRVIEQSSAATRDILLEQYQAGQPLDVAKANTAAQQRKNQAVLDTRAPREPREPRAPQTQIVETADGTYVVDKATGQAKQVTLPGSSPGASPAGTPQPLPGKKMSGEQSKAFNYGSRALQASQLLDGLEAKGVTGQNFAAYLAEQGPVIGGVLGAGAATVLAIYTGGIGFGAASAITAAGVASGIALSTPLANLLRSPEEQQYAAAKLDFISSVLRKESGAAITKDEAAKEDRRYFAQSGDALAVIAQKRQARLGVLATLATEAGRPLMLPQPAPTPQTPTDAGIIPTPGGGEGTVRVQQPQAPPRRQVPEQLSSLLVQMSPEVILRVSNAAIEGVTSPSDVPGLSVPQQRALLIRLQRRAQDAR